jgi:epoxyqueuosine reductase QueG
MDRFAAEVLGAASARLAAAGEETVVVQPTLGAPVALDFVKLGVLAGLGTPSRIGLLLSERFGPWMALRGALFTSADFGLAPRAGLALRAEAPDLCAGCPAPCVSACPEALPGSAEFPWQRCFDARKGQPPCQLRCGARAACVVTPAERYDDLEITYHYHRSQGRAALCAHFGVRDTYSLGQMG